MTLHDVQLIKVEKVKSSHGEWFFRFAGAIKGERIGDTVDMDASAVDRMGMEQAKRQAQRTLLTVAQYLGQVPQEGPTA